jgi:hypothetical protein
MNHTIQIADPAEFRGRAQRCRERAESSNIANTELLEAADTWEELARHAEALRDAFRRLDSAQGAQGR